jgi:isoleucyl-tRNA synthetase
MAELAKFIRETVEAYSVFQYKLANEIIFRFCYDTLSAVYLAATKDRLYCERSDSRKRRRSQTAMYRITDALVRLLAPILVHTADEAYLSLKGLPPDSEESVHLTGLPEFIDVPSDQAWDEVLELRGRVLKALEEAKDAQGISNPLDAGVEVTVDGGLYKKLKPFEPELPDIAGVSRFEIIEGKEVRIKIVDLSGEPRCERSWKRDGTVKERPGGGLLSDRDAEALGVD